MFENEGSPFDSFGSFEGSNEKQSEQDSFYTQKATYLEKGSISNDLNVRGKRYGQMSILDKMRGIQANRLNTDSESVSLAEGYADKSLDKRVMNGRYNTTITDLYQDKTKYDAYFGLISDGIVEIKENAQIHSDSDISQLEDTKPIKEINNFNINEKNVNSDLKANEFSNLKNSEEVRENEYKKENISLETFGSKYDKQEEDEKKRKKKKKETGIKENFLNQNQETTEEEEKKRKKKKKETGIKENFLNQNQETTEEEEEEKKEKILESKGTQGLYADKDEDEDDLKKLKVGKIIAGGLGVYGEDSIDKKNEDKNLLEKIREIINKMSDDKISIIIQKYDLKREKDHKDKIKLKVAREILKERSFENM